MASLTSARGAASSFIDALRAAVDRPHFQSSTNAGLTPRWATPWGDGIDAVNLSEFAKVVDLQQCSPDEYIRIFPRCARAPGGALPLALRFHLANCVAARAARLGAAAPQLKSLSATDVKRISATQFGDWFGDGVRGERAKAIESDMLLFADELLWRAQNNTIGRFGERKAASTGFVTGIHPFYFWPEALPMHERFAAIGWLGYLNRGRRAYMPIDIAEYFLDIIQSDAADQLIVNDASAAFFLGHPAAVAEIYRVAALRAREVRVLTKRLRASRAPSPSAPVFRFGLAQQPYVTFVGSLRDNVW
jgi:hypothetical protein